MSARENAPAALVALCTDWPVPSLESYVEVVAQLLMLAESAAELETRRQYTLLAGLYENLACYSARMANAPPLPIILPADTAGLPGDPAS